MVLCSDVVDGQRAAAISLDSIGRSRMIYGQAQQALGAPRVVQHHGHASCEQRVKVVPLPVDCCRVTPSITY
jgi:hypothetical protein